jgi:hypothetical protein
MSAQTLRPAEDAARADLEDLTRLRDEIRALMQLIPGALVPGAPMATGAPDRLSDEDATEAGFDNLPL